jgi:hypothetical protein
MKLYHDTFEEINCTCSGEEAEAMLGLVPGLIGDKTVSITSELTDYGTIYTVEEIECEPSEQNFQMEGMR